MTYGTLVRITTYPKSNVYMVTRVDFFGNVWGRLVAEHRTPIEFLGHLNEMHPV